MGRHIVLTVVGVFTNKTNKKLKKLNQNTGTQQGLPLAVCK